jgi:hypothetical protein
VSKVHLHGAGHGPGHHGGHDEEPPRPPEDDAPAGQSSPRRPWARHLELIITIALGLAVVVGAFAAYRNEQRNHSATEQFSLGVRNFDDAGQFYSTGNATFTNDQSLFLEYAKAVQQNNKDLAVYIFNNLMDPTLQAAVRWWEGPNARSSNPARTPFTDKNPDFKVPQIAAAAQRTQASRTNFEAGRKEQDKADHFTLVEVILATALFLYGIAGVTRNMTIKLGTLFTGALIFLLSVILLLTD